MDRGPSRTQQRKAAKRAARRKTAETANVERAVRYFHRAGAFSAVASGMSLLLLPDAYPYFVFFACAAILLWAADAFVELREYRYRYRLVPVVVGVAAILVFSKQFIFVPLPLSESVWSTGGAYQPGSIVNGIPWSSKFRDIHVTIANDSEYDYTQLTFLLRPKHSVIAASLVTTLAKVSVSRENPMTSFDLQLWHRQTGVRTDIPVDWVASTGGFRIRADVLPSHSHIEVLLAVADINQKKVKTAGDYLSGPWGFGRNGQFWFRWQGFTLTDDFFLHSPSDVVKIKGTYTAFYRHKRVFDKLPVPEPMLGTFPKDP